ncbi:MAG: hypothetical protein DRP42_03480 [Tenericutes bacterium]|nr:MAG: hypothetical protein DRP42_03480 [Mycoplasmatota bacterium]
MKYKRIILKLSGEALASKDGVHIYDKTVLSNIHSQVSELLKQGLEVAIVVGGGNI